MSTEVGGLLVVFSEPRPGLEQEYLDWYDNQHIPEMLALPCVAAAQPFRTIHPEGLTEPPRPFAVAYTLTVSAADACQQIREAAAEGRLTYAPSLDRDRSLLYYMDQRAPVLTRIDGERPG